MAQAGKRNWIASRVYAAAEELLAGPSDFFGQVGGLDPRLQTDGIHLITLNVDGTVYPDWPVEVEVRRGKVKRIKTLPPPPEPPPVLAPLYPLSEIIRQRSFIWAGGVWLTVMILVPLARSPYRVRLAEVALASVLVAATAWAIAPGRHLERLHWDELWNPLPMAIGMGGFCGLLAILFPGRPRQLDPGRCAACNYDLTGNESGVCPECGTPTSIGRLDRWASQAGVLEAVTDEEQPADEALIATPGVLE